MDLEFKKNLSHKLVKIPESPQETKLSVTVEFTGEHTDRYINEPLCIEFSLPDAVSVNGETLPEHTNLLFTFNDHPYTISDAETAEVLLGLEGDLPPDAEITVTAKPQKSDTPIATRTMPVESDD